MKKIRPVVRNIRSQSGSALLEALFAILIFSMGILGLVGLQASAVKQSTDAKYRAEASLLANELLGQMWTTDRVVTSLQTNFTTGGTPFNNWGNRVRATLPGITSSANQPTVTVSADGVVTITVMWQLPGETSAHNFVTTAQIK